MLTDEELGTGLSRAFHEQADPVARAPLRPAGMFRRGVRDRRRRATARAVSVTAAVAAAGVVAAGVVALTLPGGPGAGPAGPAGHGGPVEQRTGDQHPSAAGQGGVRAPGLLLDAAMIAIPPETAAAAGMPRYYVTADHDAPVLQVRDAVTGQVLSSVSLPAPADPKQTQIAAAGRDDRYVVAAATGSGIQFETLRVGAGGQGWLSPLNGPQLPASDMVMGLAVSPDGRQLAVAVQESGGQHGLVEVVSLATGTVRRWSTPQPGLPASVSWADGGGELGFFWQDSGASSGSLAGTTSGLWRLDPAAPGSGLLSGQRIVPEFTGGDDVQAAMLAPDGRTVIASVTYDGVQRVGRGTVVGGIVELSARTGRPLRTLVTERAAHAGSPGQAGWYITTCSVASADSTGAHLLVSCTAFGRLDHGRFTPLPGVPAQMAPQAAW